MAIPDIESVMGDIAWATVGAVAVRLYMPERKTDDIDVLVAAADARAAGERLPAAGALRTGSLSVGGSSWRLPGGLPFVLLGGPDEWVPSALREAEVNPDAAGLRVLPLAYLALMKLRAGRVQDLADITRMLGQASESDLAAVRRVVALYEPDAAEDIESMVTLGRLELEEPPTPEGPGPNATE